MKSSDNKMRLSFFELKIDRKLGTASVMSNKESNVKHSRSIQPRQTSCPKNSNPEDPMQLSNQFERIHKKVSSIVLTLPQIKTQGQLDIQCQDDRMQSYGSIKLGQSGQRTDKEISKRYYRQMELMKEVKKPSISQKLFTISQLRNNEVEWYTGQPKKVTKRASLPLSQQKYQLSKGKDEFIIPNELQSKKVVCLINQNMTKKALRFKYDPDFKLPDKKEKGKPEKIERGFTLEGWSNKFDEFQLC